jgi:hypothetical protein
MLHFQNFPIFMIKKTHEINISQPFKLSSIFCHPHAFSLICPLSLSLSLSLSLNHFVIRYKKRFVGMNVLEASISCKLLDQIKNLKEAVWKAPSSLFLQGRRFWIY